MAENVKKFKTFDGVEHDLEDTQARADIADLADNTYTKDEVDGRLTDYAEKADVYDKTESYSKTEVDDALALKANAADVYAKTDTYDKTEVDSALALKANVVDVYSKTETYNKTETDVLLAAKANSADVYTITQTDALLDTKADATEVAEVKATVAELKATFIQFQSDVNVEFQNRYTKSEDDALLANKVDVYHTISAVSDGTKSYATLLGEIWSQIDITKVTNRCKLDVPSRISSGSALYGIITMTISYIRTQPNNYLEFAAGQVFRNSQCTNMWVSMAQGVYEFKDIAATGVADYSSTILSAGDTITFYY